MDPWQAEMLTVGSIAKRLGVPIHRVKYAIERFGIKPVARVGVIRIWSPEQFPIIRGAIRNIAGEPDEPGEPQ